MSWIDTNGVSNRAVRPEEFKRIRNGEDGQNNGAAEGRRESKQSARLRRLGDGAKAAANDASGLTKATAGHDGHPTLAHHSQRIRRHMSVWAVSACE